MIARAVKIHVHTRIPRIRGIIVIKNFIKKNINKLY